MAAVVPKRLHVVVTSDPPNLVDIVVRIERGGTLTINLDDVDEDNPPSLFMLNLPGKIRDQQHWVADKSGLHPDTQESE